MDEVTRLLGLVADPPGAPLAAPPTAPLLRSARRRATARRTTGVLAAVAAVIAVAVPVALLDSRTTPSPTGPTVAAADPRGTAAALAGATWSEMADAPIKGRGAAASAWTGEELLVWGGRTEAEINDELFDDGAAYDPASNSWTVLPPAPLAAVSYPLSVWTGDELVVLGGFDAYGFPVIQGAAYRPSTRSWRPVSLPDGLAPVVATGAAWTGKRLVVVGLAKGDGGRPAVSAWDPDTGRWQRLPDLPIGDEHAVDRHVVIAVGDRVHVLSPWRRTVQTSSNSYSGTAGVEGWSLVDGQWEALPPDGAPDGVGQLLAVPGGVIVPAIPMVRPGSGPMQSGLHGWRLSKDRWSDLPHGPVDDLRGTSVWTGSALLTANTGTYTSGGGVETKPGAAAVLDLGSGTWTRLPDAPAFGNDAAVHWAGDRLLVWGSLHEPGTGGSTSFARTRGLVLAAPAPASTAVPKPCPSATEPDAIVDYLDAVHVDGATFIALPQPRGAVLGDVVATTRCRLEGSAPVSHELQDGDATFLDPGTQLRQVVGFDPGFRLGVRLGAMVRVYEIDDRPAAKTGADVFPGLADHVKAVLVLSVEDGTTELGRIDDPVKVRAMVTQLLAAPYLGPGTSGPDRDVFVGLLLDDGSIVSRAFTTSTGILHRGLQMPSSFTRAVQDAR